MVFDAKLLEYRKLNLDLVAPLMDFFHALEETGDDKFFHPHPFTTETLKDLAMHGGKDLYYVLTEGESVVGYGMLRGWNEGYDIPSLGISIHPLARKQGLGLLFTRFLHAEAQRRGAKEVRLRVYADNQKAIRLYKKLGYEFQPADEDGCYVAYFGL